MNKQTLYALFIMQVIAMLPLSAQAHTGVISFSGFSDGFLHPWSGLDHLLAMSAIGFWAALNKDKLALWQLPVCFLVAMAVGASLCIAGIVISGMELWVAFSVLTLGVLVCCNPAMPTALAGVLVSAFAIGHGYVHAAELGNDTHVLTYALGFLSATATLHGLGLLAGLSGEKVLTVLRNGFGLICAVAGMVLLAGV